MEENSNLEIQKIGLMSSLPCCLGLHIDNNDWIMKQCFAILNESFGITNEKLFGIWGWSKYGNAAGLDSGKELLIQNFILDFNYFLDYVTFFPSKQPGPRQWAELMQPPPTSDKGLWDKQVTPLLSVCQIFLAGHCHYFLENNQWCTIVCIHEVSAMLALSQLSVSLFRKWFF